MTVCARYFLQILVPVEERELGDPQEVPFFGNYIKFSGNDKSERANNGKRFSCFIGYDKYNVALLGFELLNKRFKLSLFKKFIKFTN